MRGHSKNQTGRKGYVICDPYGGISEYRKKGEVGPESLHGTEGL